MVRWLLLSGLGTLQAAIFMGRGLSLITGPREGVTQERVPVGHLRPTGRGTSWVEVIFLRKKDGIVRILSPLGPGHGPWVGHKPPFLR